VILITYLLTWLLWISDILPVSGDDKEKGALESFLLKMSTYVTSLMRGLTKLIEMTVIKLALLDIWIIQYFVSILDLELDKPQKV